MIRYFFFTLIISVSLYGLSDSSILKRANVLMHGSNKSNYFRAYNDYKNLYLRSIMKDDKKLRYNSLKGIVKSGNKLHIDVAQYENELKKINTNRSYKSLKVKQKSNLKKSTKIRLKSYHKLKSVKWVNQKLVLKFDKKLDDKQINYFKNYDSKKHHYRYIFEIHASMFTKSRILRKNGISKIRLVQKNLNTIRLTIENSKSLSVRYKKDFNSLIITISKVLKKKETIFKHINKNKIIVIDAGHGGKDPGAIGYKKYQEKVVVLKIATYLKDILKARGYKVYMTRYNDRFVKLSNRTRYANKKDADIFISIHANAVGEMNADKTSGIEAFFLSPSRSARADRVVAKENSADLSDMNRYGKESYLRFLNNHKILASNKLAIDLQRGVLGYLRKSYKNVNDAGVREGPFWVLIGAQMPSVLVEVGFITNPKEAKRLVSSDYQRKLAFGLANGVESYFLKN